MTVANVPHVRLKAAVSLAGMARLINMSRSQMYSYIRRGIFPQPVYSVANGRPLFTADMQQSILDVRQTGIGCNGEFVIFYEKSSMGGSRSAVRQSGRSDPHADLATKLEGLGHTNVTPEQVQQAVATCFPGGMTGQDEGVILRTLNRHLRRSIAA